MAAQLLIQLALFLIISSGSVFCCAFFRKSYESILPVTCTVLTALLFLFGIFGILRIGVYAVVLLCICAYAFSVYHLYKSRDFRGFSEKLFTPGFFVFLLAFLALTYFNYGRPISGWDEFSHWGDIVKVMTMTDDFGTASGSGALFQSYPPGISLFQYLFQRVTLAISPAAGFCEWRLFFAYQIFFLSFLIQFLDGFEFRMTPQFILAAAALVLAPMAFFSECYAEIYIDPFIGIISGAGLALVFSHRKHDIFYMVNILLTISLLVLLKDAGMLFAAFLLVAYLGDVFIRNFCREKTFLAVIKDSLPAVAAGVGALVIPKLLWSANVQASGAAISFSGRIDLSILMDVILGKDSSYHSVVWHNFWQAFAQNRISFGTFDIPIPYILMLVLLIAAVWGIFFALYKRGCARRSHLWLAVLTVSAQFIVYILGLCVIYMFKFTEHEAVQLISWSRYMFIAYLSCWMFAVIMLIRLFRELKIRTVYIAAFFLCMIAVFIPLRRVGSFVLRNSLESAVEFREERQPLVDEVFEAVGDDSDARITVISQESTGLDFIFMHYSLRPYDVSGDWSLGVPFYDGDYWTVSMTAEEWQQTLIENYDYVVICRHNDYFAEHYGAVFDDAEDIRDNAVYRVTENGTLELCSTQP